jgi:hypothetical protein
MPRQFGQHLLGALLAGADLAEAGGEDDRGTGAALRQLLDQRRHSVRRRGDDGEIGRERQAGDVPVRVDPMNRLGARIDRRDRAFEAAVEQIGHQRGANRMRLVGSADHRDGTRAEHAVEIADGHTRSDFHSVSSNLAVPSNAGNGRVMT